jgi:hypothetical protein
VNDPAGTALRSFVSFPGLKLCRYPVSSSGETNGSSQMALAISKRELLRADSHLDKSDPYIYMRGKR